MQQLRRAAPSQIGAAMRPPDEGGVPSHAGFYAWRIEPGALPGLPETLHTTEPWALLYVGIAPRAATSSATLRSRILNNHVRGNIGSSTFRFALASMLFESQGWQPLHGGSRPKLSRDDDRALRQWQLEHLRLTWAVQPEPWGIERDVIDRMRPPLNVAHNAAHPHYGHITSARARFRAAVRR